ncbi:hypothetical protein K431DRAFT_283180 [Polychaeton citri CBS 116435]|uniref:Mitochondrial outer membrane protein OM14 C-terminal domain-containing protein n=1 Tax=Polychaeton citri CBS 116435 TaxID=1314669 RepID=A0A9P4QEI5_9PEZI|nr:hypothetical protein K431DRAFT_283180 [Polychaeton citri CBS 116435]
MSYADIAAKGPKQSDEEKIPDAVPEIAHSDSGVHSLDSLQSPHISSVPSSYADQQLEVERAEEEAEQTAESAKEEAKSFGQRAEKDAETLKEKAEKKASELKKDAGLEKDKAKKQAKKAEVWADKNKSNPVVIGNGIVLAAVGGLLGFGAYRKHAAGQLTPKLIAAWTGALGLFALGDYYVSQFFFKKYPAK